MKISTLIYCTKEGMRNIIRNIWFSLASVAIISACIFLFCMFFGLIANVQYMVRNAESTVGITVFFNEDMSEDDIQKIGDEIRARDEVKEVKYVSAEEAWENFKKEYFKGVEDLAEGFAKVQPIFATIPATIPTASPGRSAILMAMKPARIGSIIPKACSPMVFKYAARGVFFPKLDGSME